MINLCSRIQIMDCVQRLGCTSDNTEQNDIDQLWDALKTFLLHLAALQSAAGVSDHRCTGADLIFEGDNIDWDGPGIPPATDYPPNSDKDNVGAIEKQIICLPSNGNTQGEFIQEELELCEEQAKKHLSLLRKLIANKSFQYSALVRTGNQPQVRTRAQTAVHNMNAKIAFHARMYNRVWCHLVMLGVDENTSCWYRLLQQDDIAASTAILNYNEPGSSTTIKLSWIWQSVRTRLEPQMGQQTGMPLPDPNSLLECKLVGVLLNKCLLNY